MKPVPLHPPELRALAAAGVCEVWRPARLPKGAASLGHYRTEDSADIELIALDADKDPLDVEIRSPFGAPGTRLWLKEQFSERMDGMYTWLAGEAAIWYWADGQAPYGDWERPRSGATMPRWASRTTVENQSVRVEMRDGVWGWVALLRRVQS